MMTRRSEKQEAGAYYVPDGNAGEVWAVENEGFVKLFSTQQSAGQYAEWLTRFENREFSPFSPFKMTVHDKMKRIN